MRSGWQLGTHLAPVLTQTILQFLSQSLAPCLQRGPSKDGAEVSTNLIASLSDKPVGMVQTQPQTLLHGIIKEGMISWSCPLDQPLQHLHTQTQTQYMVCGLAGRQ